MTFLAIKYVFTQSLASGAREVGKGGRTFVYMPIFDALLIVVEGIVRS